MDHQHEVSVVVPVFRGELTLPALVERLAAYGDGATTTGGLGFRIIEIVLVYDWGPDRSDAVIRDLEDRHDLVRPVWLMRNSGQHAATAAGIVCSGGEWVVTLDEDGQHDPESIGDMLDVAVARDAHLVYGVNATPAPHPWWRNASSRVAKAVARILFGSTLESFTSFRLIEGSRARAACAYVGQRTFLDVALSWTVQTVARCPVRPGTEGRTGSGYRLRSLLSHFWTLVLSSGTRPLRIISIIGILSAACGAIGGVIVAWRRLTGAIDTAGWASVFVAVLVVGGAILFAIGVVAEYIGATLRTVQGRPAFVIGADPRDQHEEPAVE